jgi:hypothetical protein
VSLVLRISSSSIPCHFKLLFLLTNMTTVALSPLSYDPGSAPLPDHIQANRGRVPRLTKISYVYAAPTPHLTSSPSLKCPTTAADGSRPG